MVRFIGVGKVKPEMRQQFLDALEKFMPVVNAEEKTLEYIVYQGTQDPDMFVFYEKYQDAQAQKAHGSTKAYCLEIYW